jgi:hypothetical protein
MTEIEFPIGFVYTDAREKFLHIVTDTEYVELYNSHRKVKKGFSIVTERVATLFQKIKERVEVKDGVYEESVLSRYLRLLTDEEFAIANDLRSRHYPNLPELKQTCPELEKLLAEQL